MQIRPDSFLVRDSVAETELKKVNNNFKYLEGKQEQRVIIGDVLVTKNPCSHPGDIQKLKAVDVKALKHLFNVVVFSIKGERPDQHKLSMGDLDGDTYMVISDRDLVDSF